jgi:hypothetical protein
MRLSTLFTAGLIAFAPAAAFAADQDFALLNSTGYQIDKVFVSAANQNSWGEDIMGKDALPDGSTVNITFHNSTDVCKFDLRVDYNDGSNAAWSNLNLCSISKVTLFWNSGTQQSTATVE